MQSPVRLILDLRKSSLAGLPWVQTVLTAFRIMLYLYAYGKDVLFQERANDNPCRISEEMEDLKDSVAEQSRRFSRRPAGSNSEQPFWNRQ